jgi:hypothetical protein
MENVSLLVNIIPCNDILSRIEILIVFRGFVEIGSGTPHPQVFLLH